MKTKKEPPTSHDAQDPLISYRVDPEIFRELEAFAESREAKMKYGIKISVSQAARDLMLETLTRRRQEFKRTR